MKTAPSTLGTLLLLALPGCGGIGGTEMLWVVLAVAVLFGANKIPTFARNLGKSMTEFKRGLKEPDADESKGDDEGSSGDASDS